uniref:Uncharacterized protein n=1 Tax=Panagrolaimus sp. PS1159 TaxID=55785 RepID=A0AC35G6B2_9BILA
MLKFKPCGYYSIQSESDEGFEVSELKKFAQKLSLNQKIKAAIIDSGEYDNKCQEIFPNPIFYDADERRGTLLKAIAIFYDKFLPPQTNNYLHIDVLETLEYSLKLIIADQKHTIAEAYDGLPIHFKKVITVDKPINSLEFCRQWPSSTTCESYGKTNFSPKNVVKIKCSVDKLQKINLKIE